MTTTKHKTTPIASHTPESWEHDGNGLIYSKHVKEEGGTAAFICDVSEDSTHAALCGLTPEEEANARRIVVAVNACEGISTEALEQGIVAEMLAINRRLIGVVSTAFDRGYFDHHPDDSLMEAAEKGEAKCVLGIAKATGRVA